MFSIAANRLGTARLLLAAALLLGGLAGCGRLKDDAALLADARSYQARGEPKAAIIQVKNVLQRAPGDGQARLLLGQLYLEVGDAVSAEKELQRADALKMPAADVLPALGTAMVLQGHYEQALARLPDEPAQPRWQAVRGDALLGLQRIVAARTVFEQILRRQPACAGALLGLARIAQFERHPDAALSLADRAIAAAPAEPAAYRLRGELLRMQGQFDPALAAFGKAAALRPQLLQSRVDIVALYLQAGKLAQARAELATVRKMAPNSPQLAYQQALMDFQERKLASAQEQLQLVLRAAPNHMPSILLMGAVELARGALPQSEQHLRRFLDAHPGHHYATRLLAGIAVRNGNPDEAMRLLAPMLEPPQADAEALALAGEAYMKLRLYAKASAVYARAIALAPRAATLHSALGLSRMAMGETEQALAELEQAAALEKSTPRAGLLLVLAQLRNKENGKALRTITQMEKNQGASALIYNLKGGVLLANQDMAGARASFQRALALDPRSQAALDNLTQLDLYEHHPEQARLRLETALQGDRKNVQLLTALGQLALVQGQTAAARDWLARAAGAAPDAPQPAVVLARFDLQHGNAQQGLLLAQKLQATYPERPDILALLADAQAGTGNVEGALDSLSKMALLQPGSAPVQLRIAATEMALKQTDAAMRSLERAIALQPDYPDAQAALAGLHMRRGEYDGALRLIHVMQQQHADSPLPHKLEGDVMMLQRQGAAALRAYQHGYRLQASGPMVMAMHDALRLAGQAGDAKARLTRWLQDHPADQAVRMHLAQGLLADKDYGAAIVQFDQAVRQDPGNILALNNLAWACQQQKDPRARAYAERAYQRAPHSPAVLDTLGWILRDQGEAARALPLLQQATTLAPAAQEIRYHYAVLLAGAGQRQEARRQFQQLLASKDFRRRDEVQAMMAKW